MSVADTYLKSLAAVRSTQALDGLKATMKRQWAGFTPDERTALNEAGKAARERCTGTEAAFERLAAPVPGDYTEDNLQRPEPSDNVPGEFAYKSKGVPKGEVMHKSYRPAPLPEVLDEPAEMPHRELFERLTKEYQEATTRDQVREIRAEVDDVSLRGVLRVWQTKELFVSDIAALRRIWENTPPEVSPETQSYLDRLKSCVTFADFDAVLKDSLDYSLELERTNEREWWILEDFFSIRCTELKAAARRNPQQTLLK